MDEHQVIHDAEEIVTTPLETILVVDDDRLVLQVVATILENAHFVVLQAHSGGIVGRPRFRREPRSGPDIPGIWTSQRSRSMGLVNSLATRIASIT